MPKIRFTMQEDVINVLLERGERIPIFDFIDPVMQLEKIAHEYSEYHEYIISNMATLIREYKELKTYYDIERLEKEQEFIEEELKSEDIDLELVKKDRIIEAELKYLRDMYYDMKIGKKDPIDLNFFIKDGEPHSSYEIISHTYKNVDTVSMDELRENYKELVWSHVQRDILTASIIQNTERQVDPFTMEQIKLEAVNETDRLVKDMLDKFENKNKKDNE